MIIFEVENFILRNKTPMRIITGNSEKMKKIVLNLKEKMERTDISVAQEFLISESIELM